MNQMKVDGKTIGIGLLILVAVVFVLPRLFNTGGATTPDTIEQGDIQVGRPVSAASVDRDGCPVNVTTNFAPDEQIYIVAPQTDVPAGTAVFVRLYHNGMAIEDTVEILADQDYRNTCINFVFEPVDGTFDPGSYEAEFYINGNPAESVSFAIQ
ncbi:MAG TPA: hypothetical protein VKY59_20930 [Spirillospora sp.]|nr:hypothetical protein [Spirillospora sp.]